MKRNQTNLSSILAGAVLFNSLFVSGFIGTVTALADDRVEQSAFRGGRSAAKPRQNQIERSDVQGRTSVLPVSSNNALSVGAYAAKDGSISGRFNLTDAVSGTDIPAENFAVKFVKSGSVIAETSLSSGGLFRVNLDPGAYSMIGSGGDGFFISGLIVHPYMAMVEPAGAGLQVDMTVVHPSNVSLVRQLIGQALEGGVGPRSVPRVRASFTKTVSNKRSATVGAADSADTEASAAPIHTPILAVDSTGHVNVRIDDIDAATGASTPSAGGTVYLVQRGAVKGQYLINQDGSFDAADLASGSYSLLALSAKGGPRIAAMGVIVESTATGTVGKSSRLPVVPARLAKSTAAQSVIQTAPGSDYTATQGGANQQQQNPLAGGGGGFGGGSGGGFGGGGGGGGLGALAGLAGLAGLAALNRNNNNNNTPASPTRP